MSSREVTIVGAGFAGLSLAYELGLLGFRVVVHEKQGRPGGLIGTRATPLGLVETAANALLVNGEVEQLFSELGIAFAPRRSARRRRYIYWGRPSRWPLSFGASARLLGRAAQIALGREELMPMAGESIAEWARRFGGEEFEQRLLAPALQGIYAGDPERMSAVLVLRNLFGDKPRRGRLKGSVSPLGGMGDLIHALVRAIERQGGEIRYKSTYELPEFITTPTVIATSAAGAAELLRRTHAGPAAILSRCEVLPLVTATCFFRKSADDIRGFGCLFPTGQGFSALGAVFNSCVFANRSEHRSETWILGGARSPDMVAEPDGRILERIASDRERLSGQTAQPLGFEITRWVRAIPHYTLEWEKSLLALNVPPPVYLHGNYLGDLGLARIFSRSKVLARQIEENHG